MNSLGLSMVSILVLLSRIKLLCSGQLFPSRGNPGEISQNGRLPESVLDSLRQSYGNRNVPSTNLAPPPVLYPRTGGEFPNSGFTGAPGSEISHLSHLPQNNLYSAYAGAGVNSDAGHLHSNPHNYNGYGSKSSPPSSSKSISGDYCFEPLLSCDTTNTVLYCIQGRCTCPNQWTLSPGSLPLNTVWHPEQRRCVSVVGSGCHILTSSYPGIPPAGYPSNSPASRSSSYYPLTSSSSAMGDPTASTSATQTKDIAATIIKGIMGLPSGGGNGYVYCQPGVRCERHPGYNEVGICAGCVQRSQLKIVIGIMLLPIFLRLF